MDVSVDVVAVEDFLGATLMVEIGAVIRMALEVSAVVKGPDEDPASRELLNAPMAVGSIMVGQANAMRMGLKKVAIVGTQGDMMPMRRMMNNMPML